MSRWDLAEIWSDPRGSIADLGNAQSASDIPGQQIPELGMPGDRLDCARRRVHPSEGGRPSRSVPSGTPRSPSSPRSSRIKALAHGSELVTHGSFLRVTWFVDGGRAPSNPCKLQTSLPPDPVPMRRRVQPRAPSTNPAASTRSSTPERSALSFPGTASPDPPAPRPAVTGPGRPGRP